LWFVARISNIGRWSEKTSGRYIGLAESHLLLDLGRDGMNYWVFPIIILRKEKWES
jgi:hypothetical protein